MLIWKLNPGLPVLVQRGKELQQSWFRIRDNRTDQRSTRTIAKVGGLVGKVLEIDERTRFTRDYILYVRRVRIACRDIVKVPKTVESILGVLSA
jgi:hypothetical protein